MKALRRQALRAGSIPVPAVAGRAGTREPLDRLSQGQARVCPLPERHFRIAARPITLRAKPAYSAKQDGGCRPAVLRDSVSSIAFG
jgi:hypothetical protein